jgi:thiamine kinase-like enzyme
VHFQSFVAYPDMVDSLWRWVCQTGLFAPGLLDPYTERLAHIRETYIWEPANLVSSHSDPVPLNILFDGNRLWLIDWENAFRNDPLVDRERALGIERHSRPDIHSRNGGG